MRTNFTGKVVRGKLFKGENMSGAIFNSSDIRGADFTDTKIANANFSKTKTGLLWQSIILLFFILFLVKFILGIVAATGGYLAFFIIKTDKIDTYKLIANIAIIVSLIIFLIVTIRQGFLMGLYIGLLCLLPSLILSLIPAGNITLVGVLFFAGVGSLSLIGVGLVATGLSAAIAMAAIKSRPIAMAVNLSIPVFAASYLPGIEAVGTTIIVSVLGNYIAWLALAGDKNFAWIRSFGVAFAALGGTSFRSADLTNTNFTDATLNNTDFRGANVTRTCWYEAKGLDFARVDGTILIDPVCRNLLITKKGKNKCFTKLNLQGANLAKADLRGADLTGADLSDATLEGADLVEAIFVEANLKGANLAGANLIDANFKNANLNEANFQNSRLQRANLNKSSAVGADFTGAKMTGVCLGESWNIDSTTNLDQVDCKFFYRLEKPENPDSDDRDRDCHPPSGNYQQGDFTKLFTKVRNTVQVILRDGINNQAAVTAALKDLREENTDITTSSIKIVDDDVVVTLKAPKDSDKAKIHRSLISYYKSKIKLLKAQVQRQAGLIKSQSREIDIYREDKTFFKETIAKTVPALAGRESPQFLLPSVTINTTNEANSMNENSEKSITTATGSIVSQGSVEITGITGSTFLSQVSGDVTNAVNQLPTSTQPNKPEIKELLTQLQAAIEAETDLPPKNKEKALKQVKALAEASQNPKEEEKQDLAHTAITMLKGTIFSLPSAAKLVETCQTLLPAIAKMLGLPSL